LNLPIYLTQNDSIADNFLFLKNGLLLFEGKKIIYHNENLKLYKTVSPDFIINPNKLNELENYISKNTTIITNKRFIRRKNPLSEQIHQTIKQGAFVEKW
jgi:hypothetical protein